MREAAGGGAGWILGALEAHATREMLPCGWVGSSRVVGCAKHAVIHAGGIASQPASVSNTPERSDVVCRVCAMYTV